MTVGAAPSTAGIFEAVPGSTPRGSPLSLPDRLWWTAATTTSPFCFPSVGTAGTRARVGMSASLGLPSPGGGGGGGGGGRQLLPMPLLSPSLPLALSCQRRYRWPHGPWPVGRTTARHFGPARARPGTTAFVPVLARGPWQAGPRLKPQHDGRPRHGTAYLARNG
jgi:hypothetical protein